jgi:hypothetical protein
MRDFKTPSIGLIRHVIIYLLYYRTLDANRICSSIKAWAIAAQVFMRTRWKFRAQTSEI